MGVFNEAALQRFDLVLSEAAKNGIKVIFPLVNGNNYLGGPQWYYDEARTACSQAGRLAAWLLSIKEGENITKRERTSKENYL